MTYWPAGGQVSTNKEVLIGQHLDTQRNTTSYDEVVLTISHKAEIHHLLLSLSTSVFRLAGLNSSRDTPHAAEPYT